jgi:hypothetical protein
MIVLRYPFNPKDARIRTDVADLFAYRGFGARIHIPASAAVATDGAGVLPLTSLTAVSQALSAGITNPAVPRALSIVGNVSGITGNVVITGLNYRHEAITETLALNGTGTVHGSKAFLRITSITLPARTHTPAEQVETVAVTHAADAGGTLVVRVTAAGVTGSPVDVNVAVLLGDTADAVAGKIRAALTGNTAIAAVYEVGGTAANVVLTALEPAANDSTLAIALQSADSTGVTFGASTNTTAGVPEDQVSVGWNDKLGIPYRLKFNTVLLAYLGGVKESNAPTVTVDDTEIDKNTLDLNSALDGSDVDYYLIRE